MLQTIKNKLLTSATLSHYLYKNTHSRAFFGLIGLAIKEMSVAPAQFFSINYPIRSTIHLFQIYCSIFMRLILGRNVKLSYGFHGEDRILEGMLKPKIGYRGYYVEVGSNHPKFLSNTFGFYRKGWRGVCIDANEKLIKLHRRLRPRDWAIASLVSDSKTYRTFYSVENNVLSTTSIQNLIVIKEEGLVYTSEKKPTDTLTDILLACHAPSVFDLLSVDAEEHDFEVLAGLDWRAFSPKVVVVEDETFDPSTADKNPIYVLLTTKGYQLEGYILKNLYFSRINKKINNSYN